MNTYVHIGLVRGQIFEAEAAHADSFRDALIALEFAPYDPWESFAVDMYVLDIITEERLEELRTVSKEELAQAVADYAIEHWGPPDHYILEITPNGVVKCRPEMVNRMEVM